jgi:hypothetical protein
LFFSFLTCFGGTAAQVIAYELTDEPKVAGSQLEPLHHLLLMMQWHRPLRMQAYSGTPLLLGTDI